MMYISVPFTHITLYSLINTSHLNTHYQHPGIILWEIHRKIDVKKVRKHFTLDQQKVTGISSELRLVLHPGLLEICSVVFCVILLTIWWGWKQETSWWRWYVYFKMCNCGSHLCRYVLLPAGGHGTSVSVHLWGWLHHLLWRRGAADQRHGFRRQHLRQVKWH